MKSCLITLSLIFISLACFSQKKDTITVVSNPIQIERLSAEETEIQKHQKTFNDILELISGYKMEDIESWFFEKGKFKFILKPKNK